LNNETIKDVTVLDSEEDIRGSNRWEEGKLIQRFRAKFLDVEIVKSFPLGFL